MKESFLSMAWDTIVDVTDTGPPNGSTHLLRILKSWISARLIVNYKGKRQLDQDKTITTHVQHLATAFTVEKQAKNYRCWKQSYLAHLQASVDTDFGETEFGISDSETGV